MMFAIRMRGRVSFVGLTMCVSRAAIFQVHTAGTISRRGDTASMSEKFAVLLEAVRAGEAHPTPAATHMICDQCDAIYNYVELLVVKGNLRCEKLLG